MAEDCNILSYLSGVGHLSCMRIAVLVVLSLIVLTPFATGAKLSPDQITAFSNFRYSKVELNDFAFTGYQADINLRRDVPLLLINFDEVIGVYSTDEISVEFISYKISFEESLDYRVFEIDISSWDDSTQYRPTGSSEYIFERTVGFPPEKVLDIRNDVSIYVEIEEPPEVITLEFNFASQLDNSTFIEEQVSISDIYLSFDAHLDYDPPVRDYSSYIGGFLAIFFFVDVLFFAFLIGRKFLFDPFSED